jgi:hypothetical protein
MSFVFSSLTRSSAREISGNTHRDGSYGIGLLLFLKRVGSGVKVG